MNGCESLDVLSDWLNCGSQSPWKWKFNSGWAMFQSWFSVSNSLTRYSWLLMFTVYIHSLRLTHSHPVEFEKFKLNLSRLNRLGCLGRPLPLPVIAKYISMPISSSQKKPESVVFMFLLNKHMTLTLMHFFHACKCTSYMIHRNVDQFLEISLMQLSS